ncbi:MAG: dephospho-CoA kinase [Acidobacteriota bacterium]
MKRGFLEVGLTGGIASGKSTVSKILSSLGIFVIDADAIAHRLIEPDGRAFCKVIETFGNSIIESGKIDRKKLADIVFKDKLALAYLNAIIHPLVREELEILTARYISEILKKEIAERNKRIVITEAALLVETGFYTSYDRLIVVHCSRDTQIKRIVERDGTSREEALARINSQMPMDEKIGYADYLINTDCPFGEVELQTRNLQAKLLSDFI